VSQSPKGETALDPTKSYLDAWEQLAKMIHEGRSFSGHERKCVFLNTRGPRFADVSAATSLDLDDDGRGLAICDWDHDGDLDLWMTNRTGPRVRMLRNDTAAGNHFLALRLVGDVDRRCNRDAVGARVEVHLSGGPAKRLIQTVYAGDGFLSQSTKWLYFGLGEQTKVEKVVVKWPVAGGHVEEFADVRADQRCELVQGRGRAQALVEPPREVALAASTLKAPAVSENVRIRLSQPLVVPTLTYRDLDGTSRPLKDDSGRPVLVNLFATWCQPCLKELREIARREAEIRRWKVDFVALCVDGLGGDAPLDPAKTKKLLADLGFKFLAGAASVDVIEALDSLQRSVIYRQPRLPLPSSFLIDPAGRLVAVYKGPVSVDQLLADIPTMREIDPVRVRDLAIPFSGRWIDQVMVSNPLVVAAVYLQDGKPKEAAAYLQDYLQRESKPATNEPPPVKEQRERRLADLYAALAESLNWLGRPSEAVATADKGIALNSKLPEAHLQRAVGLVELQKQREAAEALASAKAVMPDDPRIGALEGRLLELRGDREEAVVAYRRSLGARPDWENTSGQRGVPHWMHRIAVARWESGVRQSARRLAWLLGSSSPAEAVQIARRACDVSAWIGAAELDALAAAQAANGDFETARATAAKALFWAQSHGDEELASEISARIRLYKSNKPAKVDPS
jgi:tetratricopeptide (TPR) repeat protein/peroxiredoxin